MVRDAFHSGRRAGGALVLALLLVCVAGAASAQQVYWSAPETIDAGQRSSIDLVFVDGEPTGPVVLPSIEGLKLLGVASQATSLAILNGQRSASTTLSYPVRAERSGTLHLPQLQVPTSAGTATVDAIDIEVQRAALRDSDGAPSALDDAVQARLTPSTMTPWAGQVFDLDFSLSLTGNRRGEVLGTPTWTANAPSAEPWGDGQAVRTSSGSAVRFRTRAAAPAQAGRITIAPAMQDVQIETGRGADPFGGRDPFAAMRRFGGADLIDSFFARPQMAELSAESNAVQLDVRPLPAGAPADFSGAVGEFTLETTLSPQAPKTGEPVTWTLTLKGTGNWPSVVLPARAVPADLRTLQPKQRREFADGARFAGTLSEDLVLVPNQPGDLTLAPVRFTYFSPISGRYETAEARPPALHITGAPLPQQAAVSAPVAAADSVPAPPVAALEPLSGHAYGRAPLSARTMTFAAAAPFALLFIVWMGVLIVRAWQADPRRAARRRQRAVHVAIEAVRRAPDVGQRITALLDWQRLAAQALGLDLAVPTAAQLRQLDDSRWAAVWADSERALYREDHLLAPGWCDGAAALAFPSADTAQSPQPTRPMLATPPARLRFLRRALVKAAPAALLVALLIAPAHAAEWADVVAGGASTAGSVDIPPGPPSSKGGNDWIARYNLGLQAAAEGQPGHALGETVAAFAQAPGQMPVRAALAEYAAALPGSDAIVLALAHGAQPANWLAVWQWQFALLTGFMVCATAIGLCLLHRARLAYAAALLGVITSAGAGLALHEFGALTDPRAALVAQDVALRALPTDAAPADDAPRLSAGTLVRAEKQFLGWTAIRLADGGRGWLRRGELVEIYSAPRA
jgi:hypothetical protein